MRNFVLALVFDEDLSNVVMIKKNRPPRFAGRLNGVGGKMEPGESYRSTMEREFREETGLHIKRGWAKIDEVAFMDGRMTIWTARADISEVKTMTDEEIIIVPVVDMLDLIHRNKIYALEDHGVEIDVLNTWFPMAYAYQHNRLHQIIK